MRPRDGKRFFMRGLELVIFALVAKEQVHLSVTVHVFRYHFIPPSVCFSEAQIGGNVFELAIIVCKNFHRHPFSHDDKLSSFVASDVRPDCRVDHSDVGE